MCCLCPDQWFVIMIYINTGYHVHTICEKHGQQKWGQTCNWHIYIWVRSRNCGCLVTWFCYQLIAKQVTRQPQFRDLTHIQFHPIFDSNISGVHCIKLQKMFYFLCGCWQTCIWMFIVAMLLLVFVGNKTQINQSISQCGCHMWMKHHIMPSDFLWPSFILIAGLGQLQMINVQQNIWVIHKEVNSQDSYNDLKITS